MAAERRATHEWSRPQRCRALCADRKPRQRGCLRRTAAVHSRAPALWPSAREFTTPPTASTATISASPRAQRRHPIARAVAGGRCRAAPSSSPPRLCVSSRVISHSPVFALVPGISRSANLRLRDPVRVRCRHSNGRVLFTQRSAGARAAPGSCVGDPRIVESLLGGHRGSMDEVAPDGRVSSSSAARSRARAQRLPPCVPLLGPHQCRPFVAVVRESRALIEDTCPLPHFSADDPGLSPFSAPPPGLVFSLMTSSW